MFNSFNQNASACVIITTTIGKNEKDTLHFSWEWKLESCYGPKHGFDYSPNEIHYDRCCLPPGQYTLTCINRQSKYGWGNAFLEIDGKRYCDDFVGFKAMRKVSVLGKIDYSN